MKEKAFGLVPVTGEGERDFKLIDLVLYARIKYVWRTDESKEIQEEIKQKGHNAERINRGLKIMNKLVFELLFATEFI